jgi:pimeloyl-ACP methyl ester carboxylesterase
VRAFLLQNLERGDGAWRWRLNLEALRKGMAQITGFDAPAGRRYDGPAHFIHGQGSDYVRPAYRGAIQALFPNPVMCEVAGAGHWVYAEQREGFMRCLDALLRRARAA